VRAVGRGFVDFDLFDCQLRRADNFIRGSHLLAEFGLDLKFNLGLQFADSSEQFLSSGASRGFHNGPCFIGLCPRAIRGTHLRSHLLPPM